MKKKVKEEKSVSSWRTNFVVGRRSPRREEGEEGEAFTKRDLAAKYATSQSRMTKKRVTKRGKGKGGKIRGGPIPERIRPSRKLSGHAMRSQVGSLLFFFFHSKNELIPKFY